MFKKNAPTLTHTYTHRQNLVDGWQKRWWKKATRKKNVRRVKMKAIETGRRTNGQGETLRLFPIWMIPFRLELIRFFSSFDFCFMHISNFGHFMGNCNRNWFSSKPECMAPIESVFSLFIFRFSLALKTICFLPNRSRWHEVKWKNNTFYKNSSCLHCLVHLHLHKTIEQFITRDNLSFTLNCVSTLRRTICVWHVNLCYCRWNGDTKPIATNDSEFICSLYSSVEYVVQYGKLVEKAIETD